MVELEGLMVLLHSFMRQCARKHSLVIYLSCLIVTLLALSLELRREPCGNLIPGFKIRWLTDFYYPVVK